MGNVCHVKRFTTESRISTFGSHRWCPNRCGSGRDNSQKTSLMRVSTHWWSDGTSVSVSVEDTFFIVSNITCFKFYIHLWPIYWPFSLARVCIYISVLWHCFILNSLEAPALRALRHSRYKPSLFVYHHFLNFSSFSLLPFIPLSLVLLSFKFSIISSPLALLFVWFYYYFFVSQFFCFVLSFSYVSQRLEDCFSPIYGSSVL
jgi:hypothetical protein